MVNVDCTCEILSVHCMRVTPAAARMRAEYSPVSSSSFLSRVFRFPRMSEIVS